MAGVGIGGGSLSLQDVRKRSGSGEEAKRTSSSMGSVREEEAGGCTLVRNDWFYTYGSAQKLSLNLFRLIIVHW